MNLRSDFKKNHHKFYQKIEIYKHFIDLWEDNNKSLSDVQENSNAYLSDDNL